MESAAAEAVTFTKPTGTVVTTVCPSAAPDPSEDHQSVEASRPSVHAERGVGLHKLCANNFN